MKKAFKLLLLLLLSNLAWCQVPSANQLTMWKDSTHVKGVANSSSDASGNVVLNSLATGTATAPGTGIISLPCITAPSAPASGLNVYCDITDLRLHDLGNAGSKGTTVVAGTLATHNFATAISAAGVFSGAQPAFADISGVATAAQIPNPSASTIGGVESIAAVAHNFLTSISTSGVPAQAQPADADISFTDVTTGNSVTTQHGFIKKLDNTATHYMDGTGNWSTPAGGAVPYFGTCNGTVTSSGTVSVTNLGENTGNGGCASPENDNHGVVFTHACTVKNLYARSSFVGVNVSDGVVTIRTGVAGSLGNSAVTCTIGSGQSCNDTTHTVAVTAGQMGAVTVVTQNISSLADLSIAFECQ